MCAVKIRCVTTTEVFQQVVLDPHVLAVCIVSRSTIYADSPTIVPQATGGLGTGSGQCGNVAIWGGQQEGSSFL